MHFYLTDTYSKTSLETTGGSNLTLRWANFVPRAPCWASLVCILLYRFPTEINVAASVSIPEFVLERVLCANVGLSFPSRRPAASQVFGVPGPAGQIDRLLRRHWEEKEGGQSERHR